MLHYELLSQDGGLTMNTADLTRATSGMKTADLT